VFENTKWTFLKCLFCINEGMAIIKKVYFGYILLSTKRIIERNISEKE